MTGKRRVLLSWSSGKDSAWTLRTLRLDPDVEVVGLLTSFNTAAGRVAMHAVRRELVARQAEAAGLPLTSVELPWPCSNADYEAAMGAALDAMRDEFDVVAFGDLFLEDIRAYREAQMKAIGIEPVFPIWGMDTATLARSIIDAGIEAVLTCVDPRQCPAGFAGRAFDGALLASLPDGADHCGENGEFHTFVYASPDFSERIAVGIGDSVEREGFVYCDIVPA